MKLRYCIQKIDESTFEQINIKNDFEMWYYDMVDSDGLVEDSDDERQSSWLMMVKERMTLKRVNKRVIKIIKMI